MKRFLAFLITVVLVLNMTAIGIFAEAEVPNLTIDPELDLGTNVLKVSGVVKSDKDRIPMTLYVTIGGTVVAMEETLAIGVNDGLVDYAFPNIALPKNLQSGSMSIKVSAAYLGFTETDNSINYEGVADKYPVIKNLNKYAKGDTKDLAEYVKTLENSGSTIGVDYELYSVLSDKAKNIALTNLIEQGGHPYAIPEAFDENSTDADCEQINDAIIAFSKQYKEAIAIGSFYDLKSNDAIAAWYNANKTEYPALAADDPETTGNEVEYVKDAIASTGYVSRIGKFKAVYTIEDLAEEIKIQAVLQAIQDSNQYAIEGIIDDFEAMFDELDYDKWQTLKSGEITDVAIAVAGDAYYTTTEFSSAVNGAMPSDDDDDDDGYDSGKSPNRGGSIGAPIDKVVASKPQTIIFNDMGDAPWAEEAVAYLCLKGIVSGKDVNTFAPNDQVTRAELVKMLVLGFEMSGDSQAIRFNDVPAGAWYTEYLSIALANGLVTGDGSGNFNPDDAISRQDAATMMYRALNTDAKAEKAPFVDYDVIGDYAKIAVDYMYANGVINGVGDGYFAPYENLSRAAAAKMIYLIIQ